MRLHHITGHPPLLPHLLQSPLLLLLVRLLMVVTVGQQFVEPINLDHQFPSLGDAQCSSNGYHSPEVSSFICDVDAAISASSAERILATLASDTWMSCQDVVSSQEEPYDGFAGPKWSVAIIVARTMSLGNASRCPATNAKRHRPFVANQLTNERLQKATAKIRGDWLKLDDCPVDFLLLLTERFRYCDERTGQFYDVHNFTAVFAMSEKMRKEIAAVDDLVWNEPPLLAESASIQEESKVHLISKIIRLYTMLARAAHQNDHMLGENENYDMDEFRRVRISIPSSALPSHPGIPAWAWAAFISAILLSAAAAYIGMYIGSTGRFAQTGNNKKTSGMRMRKRSAWAAGFGGGVMQFANANNNQNSGKKPAARMLGGKFGRSKN
uniref:Uncharacterized protein n=1 Tax=Plectus sambesii TaxID=2011161 RepID=A0A914WNI3_9BILA